MLHQTKKGSTSRQYQSASRYYLAPSSPNHSMTFCRPKQTRKLKNTRSFKYIDNFLRKTKPQNQRAQRVSHDRREYIARRQPSIPRAQRVTYERSESPANKVSNKPPSLRNFSKKAPSTPKPTASLASTQTCVRISD